MGAPIQLGQPGYDGQLNLGNLALPQLIHPILVTVLFSDTRLDGELGPVLRTLFACTRLVYLVRDEC